MQAIMFKVFGWLLRGAQIKFIGFTFIFAMVTYFYNQVQTYIAPYISTSALNTAFADLSPSVWYFADFMNITYGVPLVLAAYVVRFLIRRIPVIG